MQESHLLITKYYDYFNKGDMQSLVALLDENVVHDINQGEKQIGKTAFLSFMDRMNRCYKENIRDLIIMINDDGSRAAAEFIVDGAYIATDVGLPMAKNQKYSLPGGAFFAIKNGKITRVTNYYNMKDWIKQVEK